MAGKKVKVIEENTILDGKFLLIGNVPAVFATGFGTFVTEDLTEKQCELLVRKKVSFIRKVS